MYSVIYPILLIPIFFYTFFIYDNCISILNKNYFYEDNKLFFWIFALFILPLPMYWLSEIISI